MTNREKSIKSVCPYLIITHYLTNLFQLQKFILLGYKPLGLVFNVSDRCIFNETLLNTDINTNLSR